MVELVVGMLALLAVGFIFTAVQIMTCLAGLLGRTLVWLFRRYMENR